MFIGVYVSSSRSTHVLELDWAGGGVGFDADSVGGGGGGGRSLCPRSPLLYDDDKDKDCFWCPTFASEIVDMSVLESTG